MSRPTVTAPEPLREACPAPSAPLLGGVHAHVFLWSTQACRACGLTLERFDGTAARFADGDVPRPEEWARYAGVDSRVSLFRYFGPGGPESC
jgi:hypothetical protein